MTPKKQDEGKQAKPEVKPQHTTAQAAAQKPKPEVVSKQTLKINELKDAWKARGVDVSKLEQKVEGKFMLLLLPNFPLIRIGPTGGVDLPQVRSYAKAWDAAVHGDELYARQQARDQKKVAASVQTPTPKPESKKAETPTQRKAKAHDQIEARMQA